MNREQQKYLIKRIDEEQRNKINEIEAECGHKPFYKNDKRDVIVENRLPLKYNTAEIYVALIQDPSLYAVDLFDYSQYDPNSEANKKLCDERKTALHVRVKNIKDNIMLGDSQEALKIFSDFVKEKF